MKNRVKLLGIFTLIVISGLGFITCNNGGSGSDGGGSENNLTALTGTVSINGTAEVGETLTVDTSLLGGSGTITYQWKRDGTDISGATNLSYIVQEEDIGSTITVTVTRNGYSSSVTGATSVITDPSLPALIGIVSITGTAKVGETLTANTSALGGSGTISYQWRRNGTTVIGTNSAMYIVQAEDINYAITVTVTRADNSGSIQSDPTDLVTDPGLPVLTGTVSITGTAKVGETLTADTSLLGGSGMITYQWKRDGNIVIGTNSTYIIQAVDIGSSITLTVTRDGYSNSIIGATSLITDPSLPVLTGVVSIAGTAEVGETLTADTSLLGGSGMITYQWKRDGNIVIGTNSTYIIQAEDAGSVITVIVIRAGNSGSVTSSQTTTVIIASATPGLAFTLISGNTAYSVSKGTATVSVVVIPEIYNGRPVTAIATYGFNGYRNMSSIVIPSSMTNIGMRAFTECIGLTSIIIPNSVTSIGGNAFSGCTRLTSITIPNNVTSIGKLVFEGCTGLTSINVDSNNINFASQDGILYNKAKTEVICVPQGISGHFTILNSVTSIEEAAFSGCTKLTSITIPNSVTSIGGGAFGSCTGLASITIPNSVTSIGGGAFGRSGLTNITIPNSVTTSIGNDAFIDCTKLTSITIGNNVTSIGVRAFSGCIGLTSITIGNKVTSIEGAAFMGCIGLTSIIIPDSVMSIGQGAFLGCIGLTSIIIPDSVMSIEGGAFLGCSSLTSVKLGTITSGYFYSSDTFPGNLHDVYFAAGGGAGTYTRASGSDNWTKQ